MPIRACTRSVAPVWTSYTTVLERVLADWRENSAISADSKRSNKALRSSSMPSLAMRVMAYWLVNWAMPRTRKTPMMASGTSHSSRVPSVKPLSSNGLSSAGIRGSVMAPTTVPKKARPQATRCPLKKGSRRRSLARRPGDVGAAVLAALGVPESGACICGRILRFTGCTIPFVTGVRDQCVICRVVFRLCCVRFRRLPMTTDRSIPSQAAAPLLPLRRQVLAAILSLPALPALAQFRVEVTGVGLTQLPIALAPFRGEAQSPQRISAIVQADLERSGQFRSIDAAGAALDEVSRPDMAQWRQKSADSLVTGSITRLADGRYDIRFRLWDVVRAQDLGGQSFVVSQGDLRLVAHRIADFVYEKLTGERGVFSTRIAYVTKAGGRYSLWVADADGENAQAALSSPEPIISPAWAPNGTQLAYVSFESRKPVVYVHDVASGRRRLIANFRGSNSAPAWSPDGRQLAVTLTRDGSSQLYTIDANGGEPRRLMQSSGIDTEPVFSGDGRTIYFVSDRGGAPQIYKVAASGGNAERVTFSGSYNISPSVSPDGRWLAYISRVGGAFKLHVMDLGTGAVSAITDTTADENPSFAPNSRLIVYATQQQGREALMTTTLDGKIKARLAGQGGDIREPDWGPYQKQ